MLTEDILDDVAPVGSAEDPPAPALPTDTRVYRYGVLPPTVGGDQVSDQMWRAHRYYNQLIELERGRREAVRLVMGGHAETATLTAQVAQLVEALEACRAALSSSRAETRRRAVDPAVRLRATTLRDALRAARAALKAALAKIAGNPEIRAALATIEQDARVQRRAARASSGVYWGTYLGSEQAFDAARRSVTPPRFHAWRHEGAVSVQLQHGLPVEDVLDGTDSRLRVDLTLTPIPGRSGKPRPTLWLRVGSHGRDPIWAQWPLIYYRPFHRDHGRGAARGGIGRRDR